MQLNQNSPIRTRNQHNSQQSNLSQKKSKQPAQGQPKASGDFTPTKHTNHIMTNSIASHSKVKQPIQIQEV